MQRNFLRSKIHRARLTEADLHYEGSIAIDPVLMEAAELLAFEKVEIYNINNGHRLETYVITGERGTGQICLNGAAARLAQPGDMVIICCYATLAEHEIEQHRATVVFVDEGNRVTAVSSRPVFASSSSVH
ncbi:MAG: aspartate 1-decarboxylase [Pirellulaceae bacterium]|jgi:aspartate 1-decarboxylase|nr:aspartate 1-decarboxylase [Pirellulaceae bacterium]